uniref:Uncharacterized protein n=1 Tax=viral metagenome TaxID=1070528 RepID=A0A6C0CRR3_9ZZZZ
MPSQEDKAFIDYVRDGHYDKALTLTSGAGVDEQCVRKAITYLLSISDDAEQEQNARTNALITARSLFWKLKPDQTTEYQIFEAQLKLDIGLMIYG